MMIGFVDVGLLTFAIEKIISEYDGRVEILKVNFAFKTPCLTLIASTLFPTGVLMHTFSSEHDIDSKLAEIIVHIIVSGNVSSLGIVIFTEDPEARG